MLEQTIQETYIMFNYIKKNDLMWGDHWENDNISNSDSFPILEVNKAFFFWLLCFHSQSLYILQQSKRHKPHETILWHETTAGRIDRWDSLLKILSRQLHESSHTLR